jgi:metal-dependent hydrolase (beta-lactamase superfamily II)
LKRLSPDIVVPMHCGRAKFIAVVRREMPDRNIGTRFTFGV